jgi:hypothetical protein
LYESPNALNPRLTKFIGSCVGHQFMGFWDWLHCYWSLSSLMNRRRVWCL